MALVRLESFDTITTATAPAKNIVLDHPASYTTISAGVGRRGSAALKTTSSAYWARFPVPHLTEMYCGFAVYIPEFNTAAAVFWYGNASKNLEMRFLATGILDVRNPSNATIGASAAGVLTVNTWHYIEVYLKCHDTLGEVIVRVDGNVVIDLSGSPSAVDTNGGTGFTNWLYLGGIKNFADVLYDDLYICSPAGTRNNGFLGDVRVDAYVPDGDGASSGFSRSAGGSNYALVDDATDDADTTYVYAAAVSTKDTYAIANMSHTPATILGVQATAMARRTDVGWRAACLVCRSGGTDYDSGTHALAQTYNGESAIWETNPSAASPNDWTKSALDAAQFGLKVTA